MNDNDRELCRLPILSVAVAVRHTVLASAVWAMRAVILDGLRLAKASSQIRMDVANGRVLMTTWHDVRAQIVFGMSAYEEEAKVTSASPNSAMSLRAHTGRYGAKVMRDWLDALDGECSKHGPFAALTGLLAQARKLEARIMSSEAYPEALGKVLRVPNEGQLSISAGVSIFYWMNVDAQGLIVLERTIAATSPSAAPESIKETA